MDLSRTQSVREQKANYEARKEQERKRSFAILSGNIQPIHTSFHLKSGEHAYFQCPAQRMADREYVKSYTQGRARSPFIKGGILRGNTKIDTITSQVRGTRREAIDSGSLLFTNRRVLFVGEKQVVDVAYDDIIAVDFSSSSSIIKYPQMLTGESYSCDGEEVELYYKGIQRLIGRDKSVPKLEDVKVNWVEFEDPKEKSSGSKWYKSNAVSILLLFIFFPLGLFMMWKFTKWNKKVKWTVTGVGVFVYTIFIIGANSSPTQQSQEKPPVPVKTQRVEKPTLTVSPMTPTQAYIAQIMNIHFDQMDADSSDTSDISSKGVTQVKSVIQESIKTSQDILSTLHALHVPQEMTNVQFSLVAGVNLSIQANNQFLQGLITNNVSDVASAKNMFTQADADVAQGENLLYAYEQQRYGSFATMSFTFNGITIQNKFDVPIDCQIYMEASAKHWSIAWDYHEDMVSDSNNSLTIDPFKSKTLAWSHITDGNDQSTFNYPPSEPYDVQLDCDLFNHALSKQITQKMESQ